MIIQHNFFGTIVVCHFHSSRGGGEGSSHQSGTRALKMNSIYDFVACGTYLVDKGFVHKNRLAAIGCSAGGLLVGAAINMHHNLFSAAILKVMLAFVQVHDLI